MTTEKEVLIYASAITGFEVVSASEVKKKLACSREVATLPGQVRFVIGEKSIPEVLKLRSVDNLYAIFYDEVLPGISKIPKEEALETFRTAVIKMDWAKAIDFWQKANGRSIKGGVEEVKARGKHYSETSEKQGDVEEDAPKFRVTCFRAGDKKEHTVTSMEVAAKVGAELNNIFGWRPDMKNYDMEIVLKLAKDSVLVMIALNNVSLFKRNIVAFGPTTMRSTMCYNMIAFAEPKSGDIVVRRHVRRRVNPDRRVLLSPRNLFVWWGPLIRWR